MLPLLACTYVGYVALLVCACVFLFFDASTSSVTILQGTSPTARTELEVHVRHLAVVVLVVSLALSDILAIAFLVRRYLRTIVLPADEAASVMFNASSGSCEGLPEKLRGVFWFSSNKAPELLMTFEGGTLDEERNELSLESHAPLVWSFSADIRGWMYWAMITLYALFCVKVTFKFDPEYRTARIPLYTFGCIWTAMGMFWSIDQIDDDTWDRPIYLYCNPKQRWEFGSYTLRRVIDTNGKRLPAFDDMMRSLYETRRRSLFDKPVMQILNVDAWRCSRRGDTDSDSMLGDDSSDIEQ